MSEIAQTPVDTSVEEAVPPIAAIPLVKKPTLTKAEREKLMNPQKRGEKLGALTVKAFKKDLRKILKRELKINSLIEFALKSKQLGIHSFETIVSQLYLKHLGNINANKKMPKKALPYAARYYEASIELLRLVEPKAIERLAQFMNGGLIKPKAPKKPKKTEPEKALKAAKTAKKAKEAKPKAEKKASSKKKKETKALAGSKPVTDGLDNSATIQ